MDMITAYEIDSSNNSSELRKTDKDKGNAEQENETLSVDEEEYIVEKILDKKVRSGTVRYLIKWKGYEETTWERVDNMNCPDVIEEFEKKFTTKRKEEDKKESTKRVRQIGKEDASTSPVRKVDEKSLVPVVSDSDKCRKRMRAKSNEGEENKNVILSSTPIKMSGCPGLVLCDSLAGGSGLVMGSRKKRKYDKKKEPERIVGARVVNEELMFMIRWKGSDIADWVPSRIANMQYPQVVIRYYEDRLIWNTSSAESTPR